MKKIFALLLVLALALAVSGCVTYSGGVSYSGGGARSTYADADRYSVGDFTYDASAVDEVSLEWSSGVAQIVRSEAAALSVTETTDEDLPDEARMHWYLDGRVLRVKFTASGFKGEIREEKRLTIEVPDGIALTAGVTSGDLFLDTHTFTEVSLGCTSGGVHIGSLTADALSLGATSGGIGAQELYVSGSLTAGSTSGSIHLETVQAKDVELGCTSGGVRVASLTADTLKGGSTSGSFDLDRVTVPSMNIGATSGDISVALASCSSAELAATSGNVSVALLDGLGATVQFKTSSGSFNGKDAGKTAQLVVGDGACSVLIGTTSGNASVRGE